MSVYASCVVRLGSAEPTRPRASLRAAADTRRAGRVECAPLAARATTKEWGGLANAIRYRTIVDWIERVQHSGSEMTEYS